MTKKLILIILPILLLTGCYDYKELNDLAIVGATEVNKINDEYIVSAQVINPQAPDKTTTIQSPFIVYTGKGKTIQEAYRNITLDSSRFLYSNHLQILIINENLAKENLSEVIDFYLRNPSVRTEFYVLIGKSNNILDIITPIDSISSASIKQTIDTNNKYLGIASPIAFSEFANMYLNENLEIILPSLEVINYQKEGEELTNTEQSNIKTKIQLGPLAIFKDNKLQGYLTKEESLSYNILKNNIQNTLITYECEKNKHIVIEINDSKSSIEVKKDKLNIELKLTGKINESNCDIDLNKTKNIKKIEKIFQEKITNDLIKDFNHIRSTYNSDVLDLLESIYKHDYNYYQQIKDTWYDNTYQNLNLKINTNLNITNKGNILEAVHEKN